MFSIQQELMQDYEKLDRLETTRTIAKANKTS